MALRTYEHVAISQLKNHPLNIEIFGELKPDNVLDDSEFIDSIRDVGVLEPLLITINKEIIAGHRRRQGAARAGLKEVPCLILRDLNNDRIRINRAWLEANKQRTMTTEQKVRWGKARLEQEEAEAKLRQKSGKPADLGKIFSQGQATATSADSESAKSGKAMDIVAEEVGMSAPTLRKAIEVTEAIDAAKESGNEKKAEAITQALNGKSVSAAHRLAVKPKRKKATAKKPKPLADLKKSAAVMNRSIVNAGDQYGKGEHYKAIFAACTKINESIAAWEKSCK